MASPPPLAGFFVVYLVDLWKQMIAFTCSE
jgi:hypothetical protein